MEPESAERAIEHVCELLGPHMRDWRSETNGPMIATLLKSGLLTDSIAGLPIVSPEGLKVVLRITDETDFDEQEATRLIDDARNGDYAARFVLCDLAAWRLEAQQELPTKLREYIVEVLRSVAENHDKRRGRDRYVYYTRDYYIATAILSVVGRSYSPTRNRAAKAESACSIVKMALEKLGLHLGEAAVEKIWRRFHNERLSVGNKSSRFV